MSISLKEAKEMQQLATKHKIRLLVNYEITWHPTVHKANEWLQSDSIGRFVHLVVRDGLRGPKEIGINQEFPLLPWFLPSKTKRFINPVCGYKNRCGSFCWIANRISKKLVFCD